MQLNSDRKVYAEGVKELQARERKLERDKKSFEERQLKLLRHSRILWFADDVSVGPEKEKVGVPSPRQVNQDPIFSKLDGVSNKHQSVSNSQLSTVNIHHQPAKPDLTKIPRESATRINTSRKRGRNLVVKSSGSADVEVVVIDECDHTRKKSRESKSFVDGKEEQNHEDHLHNNESKSGNRIWHLENEIKRLEAESTECRKAIDHLKKEKEKAKLEASVVKSRETDLLKEVKELKLQLSYQEGTVQSFMSVLKAMFFKDGWDAGLKAGGVPQYSVLFNMHKVSEVGCSTPIHGRDISEVVPPSKVQASDPHEGLICLCPEELESITPRELQTTPKHLGGTNIERHGEFTSSKENASSCLADKKIYGEVDSCPNKVSSEMFHDFTGERSPRKFQPGQIWATSKDGLPKKYAQIKNGCYPSLPVQLLQPCSMMQPPCCGIFKVQGGRALHSPGSFSHLVEAKSICENFVEIYPKKGEVWAIYRNWNAGSSHSGDLENCEYNIVEVLKDTKKSLEISPLVRVAGYKSVFSPSRRQRLNTGVLVIPREEELGRFSHQIPAFQLATEKEGKLRRYWELDPAAVPGNIKGFSFGRNLNVV
ncbi:hypothetical protein LguiA_016872 [Lonicera macranthoides]